MAKVEATLTVKVNGTPKTFNLDIGESKGGMPKLLPAKGNKAIPFGSLYVDVKEFESRPSKKS